MRHRSSTSSSEPAAAPPEARHWFRRLPWAAILALLLVLAADRWAWRAGSPLWPLLDSRLEPSPSTAIERGLVHDEENFALLRTATPQQRRVLVLGSSRANALFVLRLVPDPIRQRLVFAEVAHGGIGPFELRTLSERAVAERADVVVFALSEFDSHRPLAIMPYGLALDATALSDLAAEVEPGFFLHNRTLLLRMVAARAFDTYHFREALGRALIDDLVRFDLDGPRLGHPPPPPLLWVRSVRASEKVDRILAVAVDAMPDVPEPALRVQANQISQVGRFPGDTAIHFHLLWRTFELLRADGVEVLVVEAPVNPAVDGFVDPATKTEFRDFLLRAERELGVHHFAVADVRPLSSADFADLTHLKGPVVAEINRRLGEEVLRLAAPPPAAPAAPPSGD